MKKYIKISIGFNWGFRNIRNFEVTLLSLTLVLKCRKKSNTLCVNLKCFTEQEVTYFGGDFNWQLWWKSGVLMAGVHGVDVQGFQIGKLSMWGYIWTNHRYNVAETKAKDVMKYISTHRCCITCIPVANIKRNSHFWQVLHFYHGGIKGMEWRLLSGSRYAFVLCLQGLLPHCWSLLIH